MQEILWVITMLKSCQYCGRIHDAKFDCGKRPVRKRPVRKRVKYSDADRFRSTQAWTNKAIKIKQRDNYLCQLCIRLLPGTMQRYNSNNLSVHHAIPIDADWSKRLDGENLITTCGTHHKMMETGTIPYDTVREIIGEQEKKRNA